MATDSAEATRRGASRSRQGATFVADKGAGARMRGSLSAALAQLADDVQNNVLRSAVYAGAKVLAAELEVRTPVDSGGLKDAIYTFHDPKKSTHGKQVYAVGVNKTKAPHWFNVEYGHWRVNVVVRVNGKFIATKDRLLEPVWVPAHPYLRPTAAKMPEAVRAMQRRLVQRIRDERNGGSGEGAA